MTEEQFWNSPLDEEEQWYEDHFDEFVPVKNLADIRRQMMEAAKNPPVVHKNDEIAEKQKALVPQK